MKFETFSVPCTGEQVLYGVHKSGLPIYIDRKSVV